MKMSKLAIVAAATVIAATTFAPAAIICFRNNTTAFGTHTTANGELVSTPFDDTWITAVPGSAGTTTNNAGTGALALRTTATGTWQVGLSGIKNLLTLLPATSGSNRIQINSAILHIWTYQGGDAGSTVSIYPVATNWMTYAAGQNANKVSGQYTDNTVSSKWAVGNSFSASDYKTTAGVTVGSWNDTYNGQNNVVITPVIQEMYTSGVNYGIALRTSSSASVRNLRSSAYATLAYTPVLEIDYSYVAIPEPAALGLLAVSGALLMVRRRRNANA